MQSVGKTSVFFLFAMTLATCQFWSTEASALSSYFTSRGCIDCHSAPTVATCAGCHEHSGTLTATKNKTTSYAPGETVTITLTASGARSGWIGARLYNQSGIEIARSTGNQSGVGGSTTYPATLSAPAPATAGNYTWRIAYLGNLDGTGSGDVHSEKSVNVALTVAAPADTTAPVVSAFTLPATATSLTVPVGSFTATDNLAVTGYLINKVATAPAAGAAGWTATAPASVTAVEGSNTFYAWAKDAAGNVSLAKSATVTVTIATEDTTKPTLTISALANGALTNKVTLNISGNASDAGGIQAVTVNGQAVVVNPDSSFSTAVSLAVGANTITVIATDNAGNQQTDNRTITSDPTAPILGIASPADNSNSVQSFITLSGTISENSTVTFSVNGGSPQAASIDGDSFTATVYLEAGANTTLVTATDLAGNSTNAKRTVTFASDSTMSLAVTSPNLDITTSKSSLVLKGKVVDALSKVNVRVIMAKKTYRPLVKANGSFAQKLVFKKAGSYTITVVAMDADDNRSEVVRNVI